MRGFKPIVLALLLNVLCARATSAEEPGTTSTLLAEAPNAAAVEFFEKSIRPVLVERCFECHSKDEQKGGLRLDSRASILRGGDSGPAVELEQWDESLLLEAVRYAPDALVQMPPTGKLKAHEIAAIEQWVRLGISWPDAAVPAGPERSSSPSASEAPPASHWAFRPPQPQTVPVVSNTAWPKSLLDHFILSKLEEAGTSPAPKADKRSLIRRATYSLIGLPPTPEEIEAFVNDDSPGAFAKVVDRLLASPHYGERWGRHWLDVARYADSNGVDENLAYANAFRYRDYVVASFNQDKPYDQFVREQLAGDLLPAPSHSLPQGGRVRGGDISSFEPLVATGFLTLGAKMLACDDPVKMQMDIIDDQVDTLGRTFLGLTLGCARCHDHKFDPITMQDYYALAGIFKSTKTMENFSVVARWFERPLATEEELEEQRELSEKIQRCNAEMESLTKSANQDLIRNARRNVAAYLLAGTELVEQRALRGRLKSVVTDRDQAPEVPGLVVLEAEDFARGNVKKDFEAYGKGIGVIVNKGVLPNFIEYDLEIAKAGTYQLELRYAAAESRPVKLLLDAKLVRSDAAANTTGSWTPESQRWAVEGLYQLDAGRHVLRLERDGPLPHVDKLALVPVDEEVPALRPSKPAQQIADEYGVNPALLKQWVAYLETTKEDSNSVLRAWHQWNAQSQIPASAESAEVPPEGIAEMLGDFITDSRRRLAERYQDLFDRADHAWLQIQLDGNEAPADTLPDATQEALRQVLYDPEGPFAVPEEVETYYPQATLARLKNLRSELESLEKALPVFRYAMGVTEGEPQDVPVHVRGSHLNLGKMVSRRFPAVFQTEAPSSIGTNQSGRLQLAEWITRSDHPLTSRVMANRIWRWHFGSGLVRTPDNFGTMAEPPVDQSLLDWLALEFVESGWSVKAMHRLILLSATYQMSDAYDEWAAQVDPENNLRWRWTPRRLEAEAIRDAILAVSGNLDTAMRGSILTTENRAYVTSTGNRNYDGYASNKRSIYLPVVRSALYEMFQVFDFAEPSLLNGDRATTTVAPQSLFMMNSALVAENARHLTTGLLENCNLDDSQRVVQIYRRAFGRPPSEQEVKRGLQFIARFQQEFQTRDVDTPDSRLRAWQSFCKTIFASSEFIYVN